MTDIPGATNYGELEERYDTDAFFHALVYMQAHGFADDNGVRRNGPTLADAQRVQRFLDAIESLGYVVVPRGEVSR